MSAGTVVAMPEDQFYPPDEWRDVEVLDGGTWYPGELRAWLWRDGGWWASVNWRTGVAQQYLDTLPAERVRPVDEDGEPVS